LVIFRRFFHERIPWLFPQTAHLRILDFAQNRFSVLNGSDAFGAQGPNGAQ
jgi:hypothetical protein